MSAARYSILSNLILVIASMCVVILIHFSSILYDSFFSFREFVFHSFLFSTFFHRLFISVQRNQGEKEERRERE